MQPYFFPYLGYYQLVSSCDKFIFFDDVNFIKKGWINRNNISFNGRPFLFTVPLVKASQNKKINETYLSIDEKWINDFMKKIEQAYKKAPYFSNISSLLMSVLNKKNALTTIADLAISSIESTFKYLEVDVNFERSSKIAYDRNGNGQDKIISICHKEGALKYINASNGRELYQPELFKKNGVKLFFIDMDNKVTYSQGKNDFVPHLSMLDVLMYNSKEDVTELLKKYSLSK
jgi:hypothetical protein